MDRRTLLKLLAASSLIAANPLSKNNKLKVIVVGAGIIGASIAYHLAKSGVQVTVIDQEAPASHASRGTFAWINATWPKQPHAYHTLNQESVANWYDLQKSLNLSTNEIKQLVINSFKSSFLNDRIKNKWLNSY